MLYLRQLVAETFAEIPDREQFKASEVCEIANVQSYVLRSWEQEFPNLGTVRSAAGARVYRRADVERVLRIKQLVFGEGLTLAGARRRLEGSEPAVAPEDVPDCAATSLDDDARIRLSTIRRDLRSLLDMLDERPVPVGGASVKVGPAQPALPEMDCGAGEAGATGWPSRSKPRPGKRDGPGARV
jgi:DNA-binding transcriptional MerR regulator